MKKYVNGKYIELTEEELEEQKKLEEQFKAEPEEPTASERLDALEQAMLKLAEVLANGSVKIS